MFQDDKIVEKPWGHEIIWALTDRYVGKILAIKKGHQLSFQYHQKKEETIRLNMGKMELIVEKDLSHREIIVMKPGDSYHIPPGLRHRMKALEDCEVIEVSTPELNDVIRLEDDYRRG